MAFSTLSRAQLVCRFMTEKGQAVQGAIVTYMPLSGESAITGFTDRKGELTIPASNLPAIVQAHFLGFKDVKDTVADSGSRQWTMMPASSTLGEVVVTGDYRGGYQSGSVHQVDVITRDEIDRRAAVNLDDLLSQELNMRVSNDPSLGSSVSIQGTGGEHVKILVDGVPVTGRKNGNIDLDQINLNNIERVEVVKGPMSVLYGSDALGGVINLITRKPSGEKTRVGFNAYMESVGTYNAGLSAETGVGKTTFSMDLGRNFFDGWSLSDTGRWQQWKPKEQYFGNLRVGATLNKTVVTFTSNYFREEMINKSEPVITPYYANAVDQQYRTWRVVQQLQLVQQLSKSSSLNFSGAYSWYQYIKNTWIKDMVDLDEWLSEDLMDDDTTRFNTLFGRLVYNWNPDSSAWKFLAGADVNHDKAIGQRIDGNEHTIAEAAIFSSADYTWKNITFRPSVRAIYNSEYDGAVVPAFNILYAKGKFSVRAGYSAGYRSPSIKELYLNFFDNGIHNVQGNPDLQPENSNNFNASGEYRTISGKYTITTSVSTFYNAIHNRITLVAKDFTTGLYQYDNLDEFYSRGGEARLRVSKSGWGIEYGFSYTGTNDVLKDYDKQADIAWYPEMNATADYTIASTKTTLSVFWKLNGERPVYRYENDLPVQYLNEAYQMLDASVRQPLFKDQLMITVGAKNILDVTNVQTMGAGGVHSGNAGDASPVAMGTFFFTKISFDF